MYFLAWQFNKKSDSSSSRKLFRFSLLHLPILMIMMLVSKKSWSSQSDKNENKKIDIDKNKQTNIIDNLTNLLSPTSA